jgi:hypothetical protein
MPFSLPELIGPAEKAKKYQDASQKSLLLDSDDDEEVKQPAKENKIRTQPDRRARMQSEDLDYPYEQDRVAIDEYGKEVSIHKKSRSSKKVDSKRKQKITSTVAAQKPKMASSTPCKDKVSSDDSETITHLLFSPRRHLNSKVKEVVAVERIPGTLYLPKRNQIPISMKKILRKKQKTNWVHLLVKNRKWVSRIQNHSRDYQLKTTPTRCQKPSKIRRNRVGNN